MVGRVLDEAGLSGGAVVGGAVRDDALLVTSEMLANAVRACRVRVSLRIEVHRTWLKVVVSDDSPAPAVRRHPGPEDPHGRGVDIVASLSSEWGQTAWDGSVKTVWSRLNLPPEAALAIDCYEE